MYKVLLVFNFRLSNFLAFSFRDYNWRPTNDSFNNIILLWKQLYYIKLGDMYDDDALAFVHYLF